MTETTTTADLGRLLRELRRREARERGGSTLTYREIATKTGWSVAAVGEYFAGTTLPPTDRFDVLVQLLGATGAEQRALADARDRVEELRRPPAPDPTGPPIPAGPRQLPADVYGFTGRTGPLAALDGLLANGPGRAVVISAVSGTAGVGKTALAVHWAHAVAERFPDGQLYADLRGYSTDLPVPPEDALAGFLRALGAGGSEVPSGLDERAAAYRTRLAGRRILVVLDNARTAEQVRPLLPGTATCLVVVTSRDDLAGLVARDGARRMDLDVLTPDEAAELLRTLIGARVDADPTAAQALAERCARLPLALRIVAAHAVAQPDLSLRELGLDSLTGPDPATNLQTVFSWSYRALGPAAARLFRLLGLHPGAHLSAAAAASLAGLPSVASLLDDLMRAHLILSPVPGRFGMHDLLRAYAAELARSTRPVDTDTAIERLLDHYLHTAIRAAQRLAFRRKPIDVSPPAADVVPEDLPDGPAALAWFTAEHRVILAAIHHAADTGRDAYVWRLAWTLTDFLDRQGHWHDLVAVQRLAVEATRRLGDPAAETKAHNGLAHGYIKLNQLDQAHAHYERALALSRDREDPDAAARAHLNVCLVLDQLGRYADGLHHAQQAVTLHGRCGNHAEEANALNAVGWMYAQLGDYHPALAHCRRALDLVRQHGYRHSEGATLDSLGYIHRRLGERDQAAACYRGAATILCEIGDPYQEALALEALGELTHGDEARTAWQRALALMEQLKLPEADRVRARLTATTRQDEQLAL